MLQCPQPSIIVSFAKKAIFHRNLLLIQHAVIPLSHPLILFTITKKKSDAG